LAQYIEPRQIPNEDEVSLVDIIRFFRLNWKFLALVTVVLSSIAITFSLLKPQQYQKQLTLSVKPTSYTFSSVPVPSMSVEEVRLQAVEFLQNQKLNNITTTAAYDASSQKINLTLQSPDQSALAGASDQAISQLKTQFQKILSADLERGLSTIRRENNRVKRVQAQLEKQVNQLPPINKTDPKQFHIEARLRSLEAQRANLAASMAANEVDQEYLEQAKGNLAQVAEQAIAVQVLRESEVQQTGSLRVLIVIAVIASFMVAVFTALIRSQVPRFKEELSRKQINANTDV
jgi:hypothetical protein